MRIVLVGDFAGVRQLLKFIPTSEVVAIVGASRRSEYLDDLTALSSSLGVRLVVQPPNGSSEEVAFAREIESSQPDLLLVNSYSMLIPESIIKLARLGGLNIHASLLPRNRGPNPVQWAIIQGERETGVTLHFLDAEFDQGAIVDQIKVKINRNDSWITLRDRLFVATEALLCKNACQILDGNVSGVAQNESLATKNHRRTEKHSEFALNDPIGYSFRLHLASLPPLRPAWLVLADGRVVEFAKRVSLFRFSTTILTLRVQDYFLKLMAS